MTGRLARAGLAPLAGALLASATLSAPARADIYPSPRWAKNLVIYELNPRGFTSPAGVGDGNGSGTFDSLRAKLPYLQHLGINAIWLAGYLQATNHFFGVWSVYADMDPRVLDPNLGTQDDLRALVADAHRHGIRVILDVIAHGVLNESPLVEQHPGWFVGQHQMPWDMADYNYRNPDFQNWWVDLWTGYVRTYGVDGFRIDLGPSGGEVSNPDYQAHRSDFLATGQALWTRIARNAAAMGHPVVVFGEDAFGYGDTYQFGQHDNRCDSGCPTDIPSIFSAQHSDLASMQLSSHDEGYDEPASFGPFYQVRGSRYKFAYDALFAPLVPIFFSGEEFDVTQVQLPNVQTFLLGGGPPGGWLYGDQLQWQDLQNPEKAAMLADVTRMLAIRRANGDILNADHATAHLAAVPASGSGPVPYARWLPGRRVIIVAGNDGTAAVTRTLRPQLGLYGIAGHARYTLADLFTGRARTVRGAAVQNLTVSVPADHTPGGGFRILEITPARRVPNCPRAACCQRRIGRRAGSHSRRARRCARSPRHRPHRRR